MSKTDSRKRVRKEAVIMKSSFSFFFSHWFVLQLGMFSITVSGQTCSLNSGCARTSGFSLILDLNGASVTSGVQFFDPDGAVVGFCTSPPSPSCLSSISNVVTQDTAGGIITLNVIQANVNVTNSVGNWSCLHGSSRTAVIPQICSVGSLTVSTTDGSKSFAADDGKDISFRIDCVYPSPSFKVEYVVNGGDFSEVLQKESTLSLKSTTASCTVDDSRAVGYTGNFATKCYDSFKGKEMKIRVTAVIPGWDSRFAYPSIVSSFTVTSVDYRKLVACLLTAIGMYVLVVVIGIVFLHKKNYISYVKLKVDKWSVVAIVIGFVFVVGFASIIGWITSVNCCEIAASIGSGFGIGLLTGIVVLFIIYRRCRDPRLHVDNFSFEKILIGMRITLPAVKFTGTQIFFVKWYFEKEEVSCHSTTIHYSDTRSKKGNVKEIEDSNRFSIKTSDKSTSLTILNAQENDTGKYYAVFEGLGTAEIKIHVEKDTKVREEINMTSEHLQSGKSLLDNVPPDRQLPPPRLPPIENKKMNQDKEML